MAEPHNQVYRSRRKIMIDNFLGGISWGVGSAVGATLVVSILALLLAQSTQLPLVGKIVESVMTEVERQQAQ